MYVCIDGHNITSQVAFRYLGVIIVTGIDVVGRTLTTQERRDKRQTSLDEWQIRWDNGTKGPMDKQTYQTRSC